MSHDLHPPRHAHRTATHYVKRTQAASKTRPNINVSPGRKCTEPLFDSRSMLVDVRTGFLRDGHADCCAFVGPALAHFEDMGNATDGR